MTHINTLEDGQEDLKFEPGLGCKENPVSTNNPPLSVLFCFLNVTTTPFKMTHVD